MDYSHLLLMNLHVRWNNTEVTLLSHFIGKALIVKYEGISPDLPEPLR